MHAELKKHMCEPELPYGYYFIFGCNIQLKYNCLFLAGDKWSDITTASQ